MSGVTATTAATSRPSTDSAGYQQPMLQAPSTQRSTDSAGYQQPMLQAPSAQTSHASHSGKADQVNTAQQDEPVDTSEEDYASIDERKPTMSTLSTLSTLSANTAAASSMEASQSQTRTPFFFQNSSQAKSGFEMCFDTGYQHLGCWGQNTPRIQNKEVYATLHFQATETATESDNHGDEYCTQPPSFLATQGKCQLLHPATPYYPFPRGKFHTRGNIWSFTVG